MTFQVKTELMFCPPEHIHTNTTLSQPSTTDASSSSMLDEELFGKADDTPTGFRELVRNYLLI